MNKNRPPGLPSLLCAATLLLVVSLLPLRPAGAQNSQTLRVSGAVTDTAGKAIEGATITLLLLPNGMTIDSTLVRTNESGEYNIAMPIPGKWNGGSYAIIVRRLGYNIVGHQKALPNDASNGITAKVSFRLVPLPTTLGSVTVRGNRGSALASRRITAAEIDAKHAYNAIGILTRQRPGMLGDTDRCPIPPYARGTNAYAVDKIYVNGRRMDMYGRTPWNSAAMNLPRGASISPEVLAVLEDIDAADVDQIQLIDCNDSSFPIDRRKALYVALKPKPLTKKQKKALDELRRKEATTDSSAASATPDSTKN